MESSVSRPRIIRHGDWYVVCTNKNDVLFRLCWNWHN